MLNIEQKKADILFGEGKEVDIKEQLETFFKCNLTHSKENYGKYCPFDYEDREKKIRIEIKSRRIKHNQYSTLVIGQNKIMEAKKYEEEGGEHYLCFNCVDGIYYTRYEERLLSLPSRIINLTRGEITFVVDIPIEWLKKVE